MRFAIIGYDESVRELAQAALARGHAFAAQFDVDERPIGLPAPRGQFAHDHWESLLLGTLADYVIVAQGDDSERRADQLRKLVQAAVPLVLVLPACEAIVGFELDMIRHDSRCVILPYARELFHPAARELAQRTQAAAEGSLGRIEQLSFERSLNSGARRAVLAQLARDTGLARTLLGPLRKVSALGAGMSAADQMASLSVHTTSTEGTLARWNMEPGVGAESGRLVVAGALGKAVLHMPADERQWTLELEGPAPERLSQWPATAAEVALEELQALISGPTNASPPLAHSLAATTWLEACRDVEVAETAERSLRKGKTYELYHEAHSEKSTFMGLMSAGGCLLLTCTLLLFVTLAILRGARVPIGGFWPALLLAVLTGFMLLQLLLLLFRGEAEKTAASTGAGRGNSGNSVPD